MKHMILDGEKLTEKDAAHPYLAEMLELPSYYGKNLDALYDCLTELDGIWLEVKRPCQETAFFRKLISLIDLAFENSSNLLTVTGS